MYSIKLIRNTRHINKLQSYHTKTAVFGYKFQPQQEQEVQQIALEARQKQSNFYNWVLAYRTHGHKLASTNSVSLSANNSILTELSENRYGLNVTDIVDFKGIIHNNLNNGSINEAKVFLNNVYCSNISYEFNYIENEEVKDWFAQRLEEIHKEEISQASQKEIAELLVKSQTWDHFMSTKFGSVKRYGGEGAESILPFFNEIIKLSTNDGIQNIVLGAAHRGKFNLLTGLLKCPPGKLFRKFKGLPEFPSDAKAMCDIASHFNASVDLDVGDKKIHVSMLSNPSHLEAVNPVAMGKTRAKQQTLGDGIFSTNENQKWSDKVLNVLMHGDAAFAGQGINQECLMMSGTPHFEIGGTIHLIVNNQIGFTTPGERGRSTRYCTDLAKSIDAPVIHVNGDDPEAVCKATKLAFEYQRRYRKDVFIDLNCFRRWGHNELDDPTFTNPTLYKIITNRESVPDIYTEKLISDGVIKQIEVDDVANEYNKYLNNELKSLDSFKPQQTYLKSQWLGIEQAPSAVTQWDTGLEMDLLAHIGYSSVSYPENFNVHPKLLTNHVQNRLHKIQDGQIDWATAESMAIGSLLHQGHNVRLSGEDVGRGTFSHRHAMLVDQETNETYIPLNSTTADNGSKLEVANSILSEEAVLGFEYGMAIENPKNLIIWEAQFGDFFNGAQIIIDTFIASGETKWLYCNGLVMLLPHGYDGAGSEHSSCRMERFLQMTDSSETSPDGDDINMQIAQPTTPAQYFHLLRRQMIRNFRKPLVVISPKTLLRLPEASSSFKDMAPGTSFLPVIGDYLEDPGNVERVIFCSGKHYYALKNERATRCLENVAIIRIESLCPFPILSIEEELKKYKRAKVFIWSQEEHRNMGAWSFVKPRFENLFNIKLKYTGRTVAATPAVGVGSWHQAEVQSVISDPFTLP